MGNAAPHGSSSDHSDRLYFHAHVPRKVDSDPLELAVGLFVESKNDLTPANDQGPPD